MEFFKNLKFAWNYAKDQKKNLIWFIIVNILIIAISVVVPILSAKIIVYLTDNEFHQLLLIAIIILLVEWFRNICNYFKRHNSNILFRETYVNLQTSLGKEILKIENKDIRDIFLIAFSETIRLVSNKRNGEFKMYRMPPEKIHTFNPDVKNTFIKILSKNIEKEIEFSKEIKNTKTNITITKNDAKTLEDIPNNSIELVITSPPYGDSKTTVAYGEFSRLSLQWLELFGTTEDSIKGIDKSLMGGKKLKNSPDFIIHSETFNKSFEKILKIDEKRAYDVYSFYYDLEKIIETLSKKMTKNSYQFWVVGNRTVKQENLKTDIIIREISKHYNIQYLCTIDRNILNKVMPSKNSPTNITGETVTTMVNEHIVVLKKE